MAAEHRHLSLDFRRQPSVQLQCKSLALLGVEKYATIFIPWDGICCWCNYRHNHLHAVAELDNVIIVLVNVDYRTYSEQLLLYTKHQEDPATGPFLVNRDLSLTSLLMLKVTLSSQGLHYLLRRRVLQPIRRRMGEPSGWAGGPNDNG
jgi:hypothetical protein